MDRRLLAYYDRELQFMRDLGGEFAREFPKIAGHLGLNAFECADPYVERLLEGFAFLAARVQLKLDSEFPRFTEHLLEMVYPHYLAPTPSLAVVHFEPNPRQAALAQGFPIPRGSPLRAPTSSGQSTACTYRTARDVTLWPIEITALRHTGFTGDLGEFRLDSPRVVKSTLRLRIRSLNGTPLKQLSIDHLPLFIRGQDTPSARLFELLHGATIGILIKRDEQPGAVVCRSGRVSALGFEDEDALLPNVANTFQGYRLLQEYFALPSCFQFAELRNLSSGLQSCEEDQVEIVLLLDRHDALLEPAISPAQLALFCTPVINLFEHLADRIHLSNRESEYHVIPDRTRPLDLEIHSIRGVVGHGSSSTERRDFRPFYSCTDRTAGEHSPGYYTLHRRQRVRSSREQRVGPRSSYSGSEVFLSLVDGREGPYASDLKQLSVATLCTNRDLPLALAVGEGATDFQLGSGAPVNAVRCVAGPSPPRPSHAWGQTSWRLISHLSLNYLSLTDSPGGGGAAALRELLQLYGDLAEPSVRRQITGITSIASSPIVRRLPLEGPVTFGRGLQLSLECDEAAFEGTGVFVLGTVLERFFAKYVSINSFTETVLTTKQRAEIMRWPARVGGRPIT
jgi:type VI secretion system protein ImpG